MKTGEWKRTYNETRNINKIIIAQDAHIEGQRKKLKQAEEDQQTFKQSREKLETSLLLMSDGDKAVKIEMQKVMNTHDNSQEKQNMVQYMFGFFQWIRYDVTDDAIDAIHQRIDIQNRNNNNQGPINFN